MIVAPEEKTKYTKNGLQVAKSDKLKKAIVDIKEDRKMSVRKLKPITPGQRFRVVNNFEEITTNKPEKSLTVGKKKSGGRNHSGKMTMRYIGGGHKQKYRIIDFKRNKFDQKAEVVSVEYDPNRSAFISLVQYEDGEKRYIIAPAGLKVGDTVISGDDTPISK
ncbi:unnamed protein product, partial [Cyprideis torosa]